MFCFCFLKICTFYPQLSKRKTITGLALCADCNHQYLISVYVELMGSTAKNQTQISLGFLSSVHLYKHRNI